MLAVIVVVEEALLVLVVAVSMAVMAKSMTIGGVVTTRSQHMTNSFGGAVKYIHQLYVNINLFYPK